MHISIQGYTLEHDCVLNKKSYWWWWCLKSLAFIWCQAAVVCCVPMNFRFIQRQTVSVSLYLLQTYIYWKVTSAGKKSPQKQSLPSAEINIGLFISSCMSVVMFLTWRTQNMKCSCLKGGPHCICVCSCTCIDRYPIYVYISDSASAYFYPSQWWGKDQNFPLQCIIRPVLSVPPFCAKGTELDKIASQPNVVLI